MATAAASKVESRKPVQIQPLIYRSVVTLYRIFGILTLYLVLAGILSLRLCDGLLCREQFMGGSGDPGSV